MQCDTAGFVLPNVLLDFMERSRSDGLGGPSVLQRCQREGVLFVVGKVSVVAFRCFFCLFCALL
jgi:hypothetical protein